MSEIDEETVPAVSPPLAAPGSEQVVQPLRRLGWDFLGWWVLATVMGGVVADIFRYSLLYQTVSNSLFTSIVLYSLVAMFTFITASFQWLVLRRYLPDMRLRSWIVFTIVGTMLANLLSILVLGSTVVNSIANWIAGLGLYTPDDYVARFDLVTRVFNVFPFMLVAVGQWLVLRRYSRSAVLWIPAYGVITLVRSLLRFMFPMTAFVGNANGVGTLNRVIAGSIRGVIIGSIPEGILLGLILIWILRHPTWRDQRDVQEPLLLVP